MSWVGVRYRKIALPDVMKVMRIWLDQRHFEPTSFDYVLSGSGTLVRVQFGQDAEAAEFAEAFGGVVSRDCPAIKDFTEDVEERPAAAGSWDDGRRDFAKPNN